MADYYIGEIRAFGFNYVTPDWMLCNGQSLPVVQFQALYSLIGNKYGGNTQNFNLPNLQGVIPVCQQPRSSNWQIGRTAGSESVSLTAQQIPAHNHLVTGKFASAGSAYTNYSAVPSAGSDFFRVIQNVTPTSVGTAVLTYAPAGTLVPLAGQSLAAAGGDASHGYATAVHENRQPYQVVNFMICVQGGIYPVNP